MRRRCCKVMAGFDPQRLDQRRCAGAGLSGSSGRAAQGPEDRPAARVLRRPGAAQRGAASRTRSRSTPSLGAETVRGQPAAPAAVGADLLCGRAGRVLLESVALRRRALRLSLREPKGSHGSLQALARRGLRRRSQAPHHDRHLCVVRRLFRCVLFEGAEGAPPDHRRFSRGLREGRSADRAHHADAGLRHRRQDG